jgi:hypothetical protein
MRSAAVEASNATVPYCAGPACRVALVWEFDSREPVLFT